MTSLKFLNPHCLYKEGMDEALDRKLSEYRRKRPFVGNGYCNTLTEEEVETMVRVWRKERETPFKLEIHEVRTLLARLFEEK